MTLIEQMTENLVNEYMRVTGRGESGKLALSPVEYLSFRTAAIQELQSGMGYVQKTTDNQNVVEPNPNVRFNEYNNNSSHVDTSNFSQSKKAINEYNEYNEYDRDEDKGIMALLQSIPG